MSLDNAATETEIEPFDISGANLFPTAPEGDDEYAGMSTRDLLIALHRRFDRVETIAENVQEQFAPILEKIGKNPMLKMLIG